MGGGVWGGGGGDSSHKQFMIEDLMLSMCSLLPTTTSKLFFPNKYPCEHKYKHKLYEIHKDPKT